MAGNLVSACATCNRRKNGNRLLLLYEKSVLEHVANANLAAGIKNEADMSIKPRNEKKKRGRPAGVSPNKKEGFSETREMRPRPEKIDPAVARKRKSEKGRRKEIESKLSLLFHGNQDVYIFTTETKDETQRAIHRMKKYRAEYISVPTNERGGRTIVTNVYDRICQSEKASLDNAKRFLSENIAPPKYGNISGTYELSTNRC